MIEYVHVEQDGRWSWQLVLRLPAGAEVLAHSAEAYPDEESCRSASAELAELRADRMLAAQAGDGRWRWLCHAADGRRLATSATTYPTAAICQRHISRLRVVLSVTPGPALVEPRATAARPAGSVARPVG